MSYHQYLEQVIVIAKTAGDDIMEVYSTDFNVVKKDDNSPLTQADLAAHQVIVHALSKLTPDIAILSEESDSIGFETRSQWQQYWLIDPLDGTREFVKRNGEFTVNIAFIDQHQSVLGVVYAPVTGLLYYASRKHGAYKQSVESGTHNIHTRALNLNKPTVAGSRSHSNEKMQQFMHNLESAASVVPELISMGSSLKICLVAEGLADVYPRLGPTSEWDTAAAHCVLQEAGGDIVDLNNQTLLYNTKDSLLNPSFFAKGDTVHDWAIYL
ncbi:MAG: 3'(2'),5'-bisphosphate nucleotidase CysQ [Methylotenera sp.]|uniref:3'(2'),5'-bisphosphate nucleotidase CysQ n=1 Tax=Methylotenera sp. TaxID=2051956 RepID=UPI002489924B|nr:3'(2'),5'-bisphosphate nucleotidase CysQ [Methylotenera sp.]MDI1309844.1 3'(2'),5'-bisphosphate nucleotidase CysQ [Methylotenera sp.]